MAGFFNISGDLLKVSRQAMELRSSSQQAKSGKRSSDLQASLLLDNAKARYATGSQKAALLAKEGRVALSDAVANMGGMGMTTDPVLLAKLKSQSDLNSMRSLFQAQSDLSAGNIHAQTVKADAARTAADRLKAARNTAYFDFAKTGLSFGKFMKGRVSTYDAPGFERRNTGG